MTGKCHWSHTVQALSKKILSLSFFFFKFMVLVSSIFAWKIPWTEEPGRLKSTGLQRVGHNGSDLACTHTHIQLLACYVSTVN